MKKQIFVLVFLLILFLLPLFASAASFDYTPLENIPGSSLTGATDFYTYIQAIYKFGIWAVGIVAMFMIIWGGYTYITSAGNNSQMELAKRIITDAIVGLIMALTAYLLLYVINPDLVQMKKLTPISGVSPATAPGGTSTTGATAPKGAGSGKCQPVTTGPCAVSNMQNSCFGSANADQASAICFKESSGNERALSTTDKCTSGQSFSVGLFQINLTVHDIGNGCTSAFSGKNYSCSVKDSNKYNQCVSLAQDTSKNMQEACSIYKSGGWNAWGANKGASGCGF